MKKILILYIILTSQIAFGHDSHNLHEGKWMPRRWMLVDPSQSIDGYFYCYNDGKITIETSDNTTVSYPLERLSQEDRVYVLNRYRQILEFNEPLSMRSPVLPAEQPSTDYILLATGILFFLIASGVSKVRYLQKFKYLIPTVVGCGLISISIFAANAINITATTTDPLFIDSAFTPFKNSVSTRWDNKYFYVESRGIPDHEMMTGITGWQQQVPIPQCYIGNNAWSIPLNPEIAAVPVPVNNQHFLRGAIAIATNGIPIFNPFTNTGVDALKDGQLDKWGGHSGRADDYHYHIAPLFLEQTTGNILPIAFALDGYPVYGNKEPDGSQMRSLDTNHGHIGLNGLYHYHGTANAPYMIGNMVGKVTEDTTLQIVPQARANPVRPAQTPLKGAVITGFHQNGANGYTLIYTLSGKTDSVVYSWTSNGLYTFTFHNEGSTPTTMTYNGFVPCTITSAVINEEKNVVSVSVYPNPTKEIIRLQLNAGVLESEIKEISISNYSGNTIYHSHHFIPEIILRDRPPGVYFVKVRSAKGVQMSKLILQ